MILGAGAGRATSLRLRLLLIPALALVVGLGIAAIVTVHSARARVEAEVASGMRLGRTLVAEALPDIEDAADPAAALTRLARALPHSRHVDLSVWRVGDAAPLSSLAAAPGEEQEVPLWFARIVRPAPAVETIDVAVNGRKYGEILISSHPDDEVGEVWDEFKLFAAVFAALAVAIMILLYAALGLALRPIRLLADGLDQLEHGNFQALAAPTKVSELRRIGERFNSLAHALERLAADNRRLMERLIAVQETERKELARELHDDLGPRLFGIGADVACILRAVKGEGREAEELRARARSIAELVEGIRELNRGFLARLRPLILDEMGLAEALRQLVDSWQERNPGVRAALHLPPALPPADEAASLTAYRVVQECLTNVARHAKAGAVAVRVELGGEGRAAPDLRIAVEDDGEGLPSDLRRGFGLLGMTERVRGLGGSLALAKGSRGGVRVEVSIPLRREAAAA